VQQLGELTVEEKKAGLEEKTPEANEVKTAEDKDE